jgi:hypothetical protein
MLLLLVVVLVAHVDHRHTDDRRDRIPVPPTMIVMPGKQACLQRRA